MTKPEQPAAGADLAAAARRKGSFLLTIKAVAWSFFGIRKGAGYAEDVEKLNPVHVLVAGLIAGIVFVLTILFLVRWIISSGVAAA
jgi:amino acid transporter